MRKLFLTFLIILVSNVAHAGFNICEDSGVLSKRGTSPIVGCLYFSDDDMVEYTRVKNLWETNRHDFLDVANGIVVEKTQLQKNVITKSESDAQALAETTTVNNLEVSVKDLARALVQLGIVDGATLKAKIRQIRETQ